MSYRIENIPDNIKGYSHLSGGGEAKRRAASVSPEEAARVAAKPISSLTSAEAFFRVEQVMKSRMARSGADFKLHLQTAGLKARLLDRARGIVR